MISLFLFSLCAAQLDTALSSLIKTYWVEEEWDFGQSIWLTANAITTLADFALEGSPHAHVAESYASTACTLRTPDVLIAVDGGNYDDLLWWVLAYVRQFEVTKAPYYRDYAKTLFDYVYAAAWEERVCGGGFWWSERMVYKNAITNELGIVSALRLGRILRDETYTAKGNKALKWFVESGMINRDGLVNDGLDAQCRNNGEPTWTYNQGVLLPGLAMHAHIPMYRALLDRMVLASMRGLVNVDGILVEPRPGGGDNDGDQEMFKGIYARYLRYVVDMGVLSPSTTHAVRAFLMRQSKSVARNDVTPGGLYGLFWQGPITDPLNNVTATTHVSALALFVATSPNATKATERIDSQ